MFKYAGLTILILLAVSPARAVEIQQETLANGLHVVYAPLLGAPVVHVRIVYHVGSRDEKPDRLGFAHMFEHMMFRGSAHVGPHQYVELIRAAGGACNGKTEPDQTTYFQTLPQNQLELALYLEADRMASFRVTPDIFRVERNVVLAELARDAEEPTALMYEDLLAQMFHSHPYRWTPGGNPEHLNAADSAELQQFFDRYYVPGNASLIITGGFDPAAVKRLVHRYFQWIAGGAPVDRTIAPEPPQTEARVAQLVRPVPHPMVLIGCRVPPAGSDDHAALMVLQRMIDQRILGYLKLPTRPLCSQTYSQLAAMQTDGVLCFGGMLLSAGDFDEVRRILTVRLDLLRQEGIGMTENEFTAMCGGIANGMELASQNPEQLAEQIAWSIAAGRSDASDRLIARLRTLKTADILAAVDKYLKPQLLTTVILNPPPGAMPAPQVAQVAPIERTDFAAVPPNGASGRRIEFPTDYPTTAPIAAQPSRLDVSAVTQFAVNDMKVLLTTPSIPGAIDLRIILPRGAQDDPPGREGVGMITAQLTGAMMASGASDPFVPPNHSPFPFNVDQGPDATQILIRAPAFASSLVAREINQTLRLSINLGTFDDRLIALKWRTFNDLISRNDQPAGAADSDLNAALFGGTLLARTTTAASLRAITRTNLDACRRRLFDLSHATLVICADMTAAQAQTFVKQLTDGLPPPTDIAPAPAMDAPATAPAVAARPKIILIDAPDVRRSVIRIGASAFGWSNDLTPVGDLGERILSQRIWRALRSEAGYAYVVEAAFHQYRSGGLLAVWTETSLGNTGPMVQTLVENISRLGQQDVTPDELRNAKSNFAGGLVTELRTPQQLAERISTALARGDETDATQRIARTDSVPASAVRELFARYAPPGKLVIVIVAPAESIKSQLENLGELEIRPMPNRRPGAATRPAYEEIPRPS